MHPNFNTQYYQRLVNLFTTVDALQLEILLMASYQPHSGLLDKYKFIKRFHNYLFLKRI